MSKSTQVAVKQGDAVQEAAAAGTSIHPAVDVFEDKTGITVQADMPGVARDRLEVHVDGDSLSIEGEISVVVPEGMNALYADITSMRYVRSFSLSKELDITAIEAVLTDGVLNVRIPKREEHRPRKIEVQVG